MTHPAQTDELLRYINLKLAALGQPTSRSTADADFLEIAGPLLRNYHQKDQLLGDRLCPADTRIQQFLDQLSARCVPRTASRGCRRQLRAGSRRHGAHHVAARRAPTCFHRRVCSPIAWRKECCTIRRATSRTTQGCFTSPKAGCPCPADKIAVPPAAFAALLGRGVEAIRRAAC